MLVSLRDRGLVLLLTCVPSPVPMLGLRGMETTQGSKALTGCGSSLYRSLTNRINQSCRRVSVVGSPPLSLFLAMPETNHMLYLYLYVSLFLAMPDTNHMLYLCLYHGCVCVQVQYCGFKPPEQRLVNKKQLLHAPETMRRDYDPSQATFAHQYSTPLPTSTAHL